MARNSSKYQCYATICANLMTVGYGAFCGWPSSSFLELQSASSPLESGPITTQEASWVGAILCIGGLIGNILFGWMADRFGRKMSMLVSVIPQLLCWLLIIFAKNVIYLCFSRFFGGVAGGAIFILVPLYITEISEDRIRGSLGSCLVLSCNIGIVAAFILGNYMNFYTTPYIFLSFPIMFLLVFMSLPESPSYLMKNRKEQEAEKSLRYFRNLRKISQPPEYFLAEMEKLKHEYNDEKKLGDDEAISWKDFNNPIAKRVMLIGITLMAINQFNGCFAMSNYTATIFQESGSTLSPNMSAVIVGIIQLIGNYVSTLLVERAGRKFLLIISTFGAGIGLLTLGIYLYLKVLGFNMTNLEWIPVASFAFVLFIAALGILSLPFLVISEITPPKIRSFGVSICMSLLWIFAFIVFKLLPIVMEVFGMHWCMFIFATCSFAGSIFIMIFVPETKGKSIESILAMFEEKCR